MNITNIIFHSTAVTIPSDIRKKIGNKPNSGIKLMQFLGAILDEHPTWKHHLAQVSKKSSTKKWKYLQN